MERLNREDLALLLETYARFEIAEISAQLPEVLVRATQSRGKSSDAWETLREIMFESDYDGGDI
jgi:hypothetical protein